MVAVADQETLADATAYFEVEIVPDVANPSSLGRSRPMLGIRHRPGRLVLWVFRLPLQAYHHRKGWMLGHTFLLLTHIGRRTGQPHETVAMVLRYRPETQEVVVCSAWGSETDWVRNIRQRPAIRVEIGPDVFEPEQRFLSTEEGLVVVHRVPSPASLALPLRGLGVGLGRPPGRGNCLGLRANPALRRFHSVASAEGGLGASDVHG